MNSTTDRRAEFAANLRAARKARGFEKAAELARAMGVEPGTYTHHENGTRGMSPAVAKKYAAFLQVPPTQFYEPDGPLNFSLGNEVLQTEEVIRMSEWHSIDIAEQTGNKHAIHIAPSETYVMRRSVQIGDESVNKTIPCGGCAIYVAIDWGIEDLAGRLVLIERRRGDLVQRSIRRAVAAEGKKLKLVADSTDPRYLKDVVFYPSEREDEEVVLIGRVVGKYVESDDL